jgi:hypothetical protein
MEFGSRFWTLLMPWIWNWTSTRQRSGVLMALPEKSCVATPCRLHLPHVTWEPIKILAGMHGTPF